MGKDVAWYLSRALGAKPFANMAAGWGKHTIDLPRASEAAGHVGQKSE